MNLQNGTVPTVNQNVTFHQGTAMAPVLLVFMETTVTKRACLTAFDVTEQLVIVNIAKRGTTEQHVNHSVPRIVCMVVIKMERVLGASVVTLARSARAHAQ